MNHNHVPISIEKGKQNIFEDLGFEPEIAANLKIRSDLILDLQKYIQEQGWTQKEAAKFFNETQPRISNLMNGDIERFSIDKLIVMIVQAGMQVKVEVISQAA
jgi:predicted XRE-type DNA-binding protein